MREYRTYSSIPGGAGHHTVILQQGLYKCVLQGIRYRLKMKAALIVCRPCG